LNKHSTRIALHLLEAAAVFTLFAAEAATGAVKLPALNIHTLELPNGLHAVMVNRGEAPVVTVEVWYHIGSRDEKPGKTGFAHLLEHLMFDGTGTVGRHFSDYIVRVGGIDNAYTTTDATIYWETMPASNLPVALWLEADRMRNLNINQQALDNEREVVEEERRRRYGNPPYGGVIPALYEHAFTVNPYRHLPIGSTKDVGQATVEEIQQFYDTYYVPNNATIVIAGDFSIDSAEQAIRKYFGPIPRSSHPISPAIPSEPPQTAERLAVISSDVALPAFVEAYHIPADGTPDSYPLRLASRILSAGDSGWIYHELVYEKQLALEADTSAEFSEDPNLFFVFAVMNSGLTAAEGEAGVESILDRLKDKPLAPAELQKARNQVLFDLAQDRDSSKDLAEQLGYDAVVLGDPGLINTEADKFQSVTAEQVQAVARKYFVSRNMTLLEIRPGHSSPAVANLHAGGH
jgi:zinc protease